MGEPWASLDAPSRLAFDEPGFYVGDGANAPPATAPKMLVSQKRSPNPSRAKSIRSFILEEDMFKQTILAGALALTASTALAQEVKIGVALPFTGIGAEFAQLVDRGMEQYLKLNADKVRAYKMTMVKRDVKDPGGANARTVVQELLTQDNVDVLAGWVYSPNAIAAAPVVSAGKKLAVIMNAGTAHITNMSPYYVRTSFSMWHSGFPMGEAAAK